MKPIDVKSSTYIDFDIENIDKYPKLKDDDHVKISKYKNVFGKDQTLNWAEEIFVVVKVKSNVPYTYDINDFDTEEIVGTFC